MLLYCVNVLRTESLRGAQEMAIKPAFTKDIGAKPGHNLASLCKLDPQSTSQVMHESQSSMEKYKTMDRIELHSELL